MPPTRVVQRAQRAAAPSWAARPPASRPRARELIERHRCSARVEERVPAARAFVVAERTRIALSRAEDDERLEIVAGGAG